MSREKISVPARLRDPHAVLAAGAAATLLLEWLRGSATVGTSPWWPIAQACVMGAALVWAWHRRTALSLYVVLGLALAFELAWVGLHLGLGVQGDGDITYVYPTEGNTLRHGTYPHSEYPPGAVALFTLETLLGGGAARTPNAFLMIPFELGCVAAIWALRTEWAPWLATCVALWPLNAYYWEFRFDLVPTAALLVGLLLAYRGYWYEAGFALGLGTIVKWTPSLAAAGLFLWLLRTRQLRRFGAALVGFGMPVLFANLPVLLWNKSALVAAYTTQDARTVTAESAIYLPLRLFAHASPGYWYFNAAHVSRFENEIAVWLQVGFVLVAIGTVALARTTRAAVALAALAPAVFLLANRIFSPQFFVLVLGAFACATALVARRAVEVAVIAVACAVATTANTVLYQSLLSTRHVGDVPGWTFVSATIFVPAIAVLVWIAYRAISASGEPSPGDLVVGFRAEPATV